MPNSSISLLDMTISDVTAPGQSGSWRNRNDRVLHYTQISRAGAKPSGGLVSYPGHSLLPGPLWPWVVAPDRVLSVGQIELNCVHMLNWIVWSRNVFNIDTVYLCKTELFEIELFTCIKIDLVLISYNRWCAIKPNQTKPN